MAVTSLRPVKRSVLDTAAYVRNPDKTGKNNSEAEGYRAHWVWGINCGLESAGEEMLLVKEAWEKEDGIRSYHAFQSFAPGEVTPSLAHRIGVLLAREMWGDRFQILVATHLDRDTHIQNVV